MSASVRRAIEVWADWRGAELSRVGTLFVETTRGAEVFSFEYERGWLGRREALVLDPALQLFAGPHYPRPGQELFGVFLDSSPDRWGRVLLQRREAQRARTEGRPARKLLDSDYLLGVFDGHRMGGLRFKAAPDGPFLDDNTALASPPWTSLRELEALSRRLEEEGIEAHPDYPRWLTMLVAPGRSLGGARPKASVVDAEGRLHIAKFPSRDDDVDVGAWEMVAHELAARAGVITAPARCERYRGRHHTYITRRFDRADDGARIHFASAMTMLERADGDEASYLDLADVIIRSGAAPNEDLEQLWRRIVFFLCIANVDDHLRNHGFLLEERGWVLAPAYDMNPVPWGDGLTLNVSYEDNSLDLRLAREVAPYFRVKQARAEEIVDEVRAAARSWPEVAQRVGLSRAAQKRMAPAFRVADE